MIPITSVTKEVIKGTLIKQLIPTIKQQIPRYTRTIVIKLYGDSVHNVEQDPEVKRSFFDNDLPIIFRENPPQSPDLNVSDLGYFNSI